MRKLDRLKREALDACKFRGHRMGRFVSYNPAFGIRSTTTAFAFCTVCHRAVGIDAKPLPNGIEIGGEAVALNCESEE
ncbi:MAG: hypothetical protein Q8L68_03280 [Methylococcales bacterium]|nr:hypothetical protein [Methylococcales bacterium]